MFLFKQKTSYEMRISGWSSDVCSSDLGIGDAVEGRPGHRRIRIVPRRQKVARVARAGLQRDHDVEALLREIYVMCLGSLHALFGDRQHGVLEVEARQSVEEGKSVYVRVDHGGGQCIKKKKKKIH